MAHDEYAPPPLALDFNPNHTLGFLISDWIEAHCLVPSGVYFNQPLVLNGWQLYCNANHYRVKANAKSDPHRLVEPFTYRRSLWVGPQKSGKSPLAAAVALAEGVGPAMFAGWAREGEVYRCSDHGCGCGWEYWYEPGEAMGRPRDKSLIALLAFAEDQTRNVYEPLQAMIKSGPLGDFVRVREGFVRLPNEGKIVPVTSAARSKLGQPFTCAIADESGLYTPQSGVLNTWQTIRRAVAGMQGRTIELTNPWDPMEDSAAQQAYQSRARDIFKFYERPPLDWDYTKKADRSKIHRFVYASSPWVDPKAIDAEVDELMETDPTQAERFFGNRLVQGKGSYLTEKVWDRQTRDTQPEPGCEIALGFDGSRSGDWTAIRAETVDGLRFTPTYGPDQRPTVWTPEEWPEGRIPRGEVDAAVAELMDRYTVQRFYCDPRHWETQIDHWEQLYGDYVVVQWPTNSITRMFAALVRFREDLAEGLTTHTPDETAKLCALHARKVAKPGDKFILGKPAEHMKIDVLMADILAHEAAADEHAEGWEPGGAISFAW